MTMTTTTTTKEASSSQQEEMRLSSSSLSSSSKQKGIRMVTILFLAIASILSNSNQLFLPTDEPIIATTTETTINTNKNTSLSSLLLQSSTNENTHNNNDNINNIHQHQTQHQQTEHQQQRISFTIHRNQTTLVTHPKYQCLTKIRKKNSNTIRIYEPKQVLDDIVMSTKINITNLKLVVVGDSIGYQIFHALEYSIIQQQQLQLQQQQQQQRNSDTGESDNIDNNNIILNNNTNTTIDINNRIVLYYTYRKIHEGLTLISPIYSSSSPSSSSASSQYDDHNSNDERIDENNDESGGGGGGGALAFWRMTDMWTHSGKLKPLPYKSQGWRINHATLLLNTTMPIVTITTTTTTTTTTNISTTTTTTSTITTTPNEIINNATSTNTDSTTNSTSFNNNSNDDNSNNNTTIHPPPPHHHHYHHHDLLLPKQHTVKAMDAMIFRIPHGWIRGSRVTTSTLEETVQYAHNLLHVKCIIFISMFFNNNIQTYPQDWIDLQTGNDQLRQFAHEWNTKQQNQNQQKYQNGDSNHHLDQEHDDDSRRPTILILDMDTFIHGIMKRNAEALNMTKTTTTTTTPNIQNTEDNHTANSDDPWIPTSIQERLHGDDKHPPSIVHICGHPPKWTNLTNSGNNNNHNNNNNGNIGLDCDFNFISLDGMHVCMETLGGRITAGIACLLGCYFNNNSNDNDNYNENQNESSNANDNTAFINTSLIHQCERDCNQRYMNANQRL